MKENRVLDEKDLKFSEFFRDDIAGSKEFCKF